MEPLLTTKALAELLCLAEQTIYNRISAGGDLPPHIKLGRLVRFRPSDVDAWVTKQQVTTSVVQIVAPVKRGRGRPRKASYLH